MTWKDEFDDKFIDTEKTYVYQNTANDIKDFIEALLEKTKREVAKDIFADIGKCRTCNDMVSEYNSGRSDAFKQIEQLREKYKGVE